MGRFRKDMEFQAATYSEARLRRELAFAHADQRKLAYLEGLGERLAFDEELRRQWREVVEAEAKHRGVTV
jgi:hypothetical protein